MIDVGLLLSEKASVLNASLTSKSNPATSQGTSVEDHSVDSHALWRCSNPGAFLKVPSSLALGGHSGVGGAACCGSIWECWGGDGLDGAILHNCFCGRVHSHSSQEIPMKSNEVTCSCTP